MDRLWPAVVLVCSLALGACSEDEKHPIIIQPDRITIINTTDTPWADVEVWLNDHYRVQAPRLEVGQRLDLPLRIFIAGFGQYFDPKKQVPFGIEVSAKGAGDTPVKLIWGKGRRR
jgi:hypothetical protein